MTALAAFFGCGGFTLTADEISFFKDVKPAGFILFGRNCDTPEQVKALCEELASLCAIEPAPILIDQEGGRVARLRPPHWLEHPPAAVLGQLYQRDRANAIDAARIHGALIGCELRALGITVDCLPVLDVLFPQTHDVIGDRAFSDDPDVVKILGSAVTSGLLAAHVVPVIKHIPGHGRATADSHFDLPVVDAPLEDLQAIDFPPFKALSAAPMAMTAHILYTALDKENCVTHSADIISNVVRKELGFDGVLMSDDLSMKALGGSLKDRAAKALAAGCDIALHCNGNMAEMIDVAYGSSVLTAMAQRRLDSAMQYTNRSSSLDVADLFAQREGLLGDVWTT